MHRNIFPGCLGLSQTSVLRKEKKRSSGKTDLALPTKRGYDLVYETLSYCPVFAEQAAETAGSCRKCRKLAMCKILE